MKFYACLIFISLSIIGKPGSAQDLSKLTMPSTPAFSILNYEPSAVMRPTNVKYLSTDILNSFDKDGKLLMNLGLETTPYWLNSHPNLKMKEYLRPTFRQTFLQSLSLSAATVKDSASDANKLGIGVRFKLYNGKPLKKLDENFSELITHTLVISIISGISSVLSVGNITQDKKQQMQLLVHSIKKRWMPKQLRKWKRKPANLLLITRTTQKAYAHF